MREAYRIVGQARGEPRAAGQVGVKICVQLSGCPSRRWSRDLAARLTRELSGHAAVGHLRLNVNDLVQGDEIVLEGVEDQEARGLASALERAVAAANQASTDEPPPHPNVPQATADAIARDVSSGES